MDLGQVFGRMSSLLVQVWNQMAQGPWATMLLHDKTMQSSEAAHIQAQAIQCADKCG